MRRVNVLEFVSLNGVIQSPGAPEENTLSIFSVRDEYKMNDPVSKALLTLIHKGGRVTK